MRHVGKRNANFYINPEIYKSLQSFQIYSIPVRRDDGAGSVCVWSVTIAAKPFIRSENFLEVLLEVKLSFIIANTSILYRQPIIIISITIISIIIYVSKIYCTLLRFFFCLCANVAFPFKQYIILIIFPINISQIELRPDFTFTKKEYFTIKIRY